MSDGANIEVPAEFDEWPHDARRFVLAEANTGDDLRREIDALVGLETDIEGNGDTLQFTKDEAAAIVMALGGPQGRGT